jgi:hypothetical protein
MVHPAFCPYKQHVEAKTFPVLKADFLRKALEKRNILFSQKLDGKTVVSTEIFLHRHAPRRC